MLRELANEIVKEFEQNEIKLEVLRENVGDDDIAIFAWYCYYTGELDFKRQEEFAKEICSTFIKDGYKEIYFYILPDDHPYPTEIYSDRKISIRLSHAFEANRMDSKCLVFNIGYKKRIKHA